VITGDAKGARGVVTGKHGGIEHVLVDFDARTLAKLAIGDRIQVKAVGTGLKLQGFDHIKIMNLDPGLLSRMRVKPAGNKVEVPVACVVPAKLMGSGIGKAHAHSGDYDIQLLDTKTIEKLGIADIRLGDIVAIKDADHTFGRMYRKGSITVGIVVHSDCVISGHGPGVTTIMTSSGGRIIPRIDAGANIAKLLKIGTFRAKTKGGRH
jgi:hypothetical protein